MAKVNQVNHYIRTYPVPPPFNVPAMLLSLAVILLRDSLHSLIDLGATLHHVACHCRWPTARPSVGIHLWWTGWRDGHARARRTSHHYPPRLHLPDSEVEALLVQVPCFTLPQLT